MQDTLSIKHIASATLDSANFPGTAVSLPRVQSDNRNEMQRQSLHEGTLSPCVLRIGHTRSTGEFSTRSFIGIRQTRARIDSDQIVQSKDKCETNVSLLRTPGITAEEALEDFQLLAGYLLADSGAGFLALYNREQ